MTAMLRSLWRTLTAGVHGMVETTDDEEAKASQVILLRSRLNLMLAGRDLVHGRAAEWPALRIPTTARFRRDEQTVIFDASLRANNLYRAGVYCIAFRK
jgi:hypothetical protein